MSPPQKLYRCIQIFSREEVILSHSRQIKIEQQKSSGPATQGISYWLLSPRLQHPTVSLKLLQPSLGSSLLYSLHHLHYPPIPYAE